MPEQDEVKLPPMPDPKPIMMGFEGGQGPGVELCKAFFPNDMTAYGKQCYEAGVLAERERVIKACRDLNAATDGRARGQDYVDAILGDWDGAVMRIFHRVGKGTP